MNFIELLDEAKILAPPLHFLQLLRWPPQRSSPWEKTVLPITALRFVRLLLNSDITVTDSIHKMKRQRWFACASKTTALEICPNRIKQIRMARGEGIHRT